VVLDGTDVVQASNGTITSSYVQQVSFVFAVAPTTATPKIWLYAMNVTNTSGLFVPNHIYQLPYALIRTGSIGTQTMVLPANALRIFPGQYVAVGFDAGGGDLYRVTNRNQYAYLLGAGDYSTFSANYFTSYSTHGFAFSFVVNTTKIVYG
jgi:hypothetical protein